ncbi:hypothetical protein ACH5RR_030995 [Cinchona calisaya]|uniref:IBH1-like N-terminal domain-containing protein n=1 Tax=Cinchona calisaya TaxID=153742 RepID=A0ABD2YEZ9_9GENT
MASPAISNPVTNSDRSISRRKKKKKIQSQSQNLRDEAQARTYQWKSDTQQQVYSSKLLQALRQVRISAGGGGASPKRGRAVREAADRVLAVSAKGRTRWSRAILTNRIKLKFMKKSSNKRQRVTVTGNNRFHKKPRLSILRLKTKNLPAFQRKARALGRLVPGCRKQPVPVILEEASDYIAALEMQVRAMSALTQLLSGAASSSSSNDAALLNQLGSSRHPPPS